MSLENSVLTVIKPDGFQRHPRNGVIDGYEFKIQAFIEAAKFKKIYGEVVRANRLQFNDHYPKNDAWKIKYGAPRLGIQLCVDKLGIYDHAQEEVEKFKIAGEQILDEMYKYMSSGDMHAVVYEYCGDGDAYQEIKKLVGATDPSQADPHTIRAEFPTVISASGQLVCDSLKRANMEKRALHNVIHCSESREDFVREVKIWLSEWARHNVSGGGSGD